MGYRYSSGNFRRFVLDLHEKEIYDLVLNFAFQDERIRIVTLEGSRTIVNIPSDNLLDYDSSYYVIDMGE